MSEWEDGIGPRSEADWARVDPSPPVKPEPRTSEPSEATLETLAHEIAGAVGMHECKPGCNCPLFKASLRKLSEVARAAKVEALSEVAKAGCPGCAGRWTLFDQAPIQNAESAWVHLTKNRRHGYAPCQRPEAWTLAQALQEGGR